MNYTVRVEKFMLKNIKGVLSLSGDKCHSSKKNSLRLF